MAECDSKRCSKCGESKDITDFGKQAHRKDGLNPWCKACKSLAGKEYYEQHKERLKPIRDAWNLAHPDKLREYSREHQARWRAADPAGYKAYMSEYRTPERNRKYSLDDYYRNRSQRLPSNRQWRALNAGIVKTLASAWRRLNLERAHALSRSYKARKRGAVGSHTGNDVKRLYVLQRGKCTSCADALKNVYHVDHIEPLSKGGSNSPTNLQLLCPSCNLRKSNKLPHVFAQENGRLL